MPADQLSHAPLAGMREWSWFPSAAQLPILVFRSGLWSLFGRAFLILSSIGQHSGRTRRTMLTWFCADGTEHAVALYGARASGCAAWRSVRK